MNSQDGDRLSLELTGFRFVFFQMIVFCNTHPSSCSPTVTRWGIFWGFCWRKYPQDVKPDFQRNLWVTFHFPIQILHRYRSFFSSKCGDVKIISTVRESGWLQALVLTVSIAWTKPKASKPRLLYLTKECQQPSFICYIKAGLLDANDFIDNAWLALTLWFLADKYWHRHSDIRIQALEWFTLRRANSSNNAGPRWNA